jgi:Cu2+-containing amine oxidase
MAEHINGKTVPWSQMEQYLTTHQQTIAAFVDLKNLKVMEVPMIEAVLPNSFLQLHEVITKILKDNGIISNEEESKVD